MSNNNLSRSIFSAFISKYESVMQREIHVMCLKLWV
jgi:hypothetical protein